MLMDEHSIQMKGMGPSFELLDLVNAQGRVLMIMKGMGPSLSC